MKNIGSRIAALNVLKDILEEDCFLQDVIDKRIWEQDVKMQPRDRAFVRALVATVLRRLGQIDALINHCIDRPLPEKASRVKGILQLGIAQMFFLETPPHAAVNTSVDMASIVGCTPYKKLINAVLRRLGREGNKLVESQDAARLNTPDWLWESWSKAYGEENCRKIAERHLEEAPIDISVKESESLEKWAIELDAEKLPNGSLRLKSTSGQITELVGFSEGAWWVQSVAASLPVLLFGDIKGKNIADLCAAPGGKTSQLAALGANVSAMDSSGHRLKRLNQNLDRLQMKAKVIAADATRWTLKSAGAAPFDGVLIDAPCSSTGTIRRHPDVARIKTEKDVKSLMKIQKKLLKSAVNMVGSGGIVIYCVCSIQPEEGEGIIKQAIAEGLPVERMPLTAEEFPNLVEMIAKDGSLRSLPFNFSEYGGADGFYAVRLKKV